MHLMAVGADNNKVPDVVVLAVAIHVSDLQNLWHSKSAISADRRIMLECKFSVIRSPTHDMTPAKLLSLKVKAKGF